MFTEDSCELEVPKEDGRFNLVSYHTYIVQGDPRPMLSTNGQNHRQQSFVQAATGSTCTSPVAYASPYQKPSLTSGPSKKSKHFSLKAKPPTVGEIAASNHSWCGNVDPHKDGSTST